MKGESSTGKITTCKYSSWGSSSLKHVNPSSSSLSPTASEIKISSDYAISASFGKFLKIYIRLHIEAEVDSSVPMPTTSNYYLGFLLADAAGENWTLTSEEAVKGNLVCASYLRQEGGCGSHLTQPCEDHLQGLWWFRQWPWGTSLTRLEAIWRQWFPPSLLSRSIKGDCHFAIQHIAQLRWTLVIVRC